MAVVEGTRQVVDGTVMAKINFNFDSCRIWNAVCTGANVPFVLVQRLPALSQGPAIWPSNFESAFRGILIDEQ